MRIYNLALAHRIPGSRTSVIMDVVSTVGSVFVEGLCLLQV